jgi:hypothetical protein
LHVHTMHEILQVVNFYLLFFSLFFDGLAAVDWHTSCSQHTPCQPPHFSKNLDLDILGLGGRGLISFSPLHKTKHPSHLTS